MPAGRPVRHPVRRGAEPSLGAVPQRLHGARVCPLCSHPERRQRDQEGAHQEGQRRHGRDHPTSGRAENEEILGKYFVFSKQLDIYYIIYSNT